jgi:hypothetical protein
MVSHYDSPEKLVSQNGDRYLRCVEVISHLKDCHLDVEYEIEKVGILSCIEVEGPYFANRLIYVYYLYEDEKTAASKVDMKNIESDEHFWQYVRPYILEKYRERELELAKETKN